MKEELTEKQLKLFLGKVAIDLRNIELFDFKIYAKNLYNLIIDKAGDRVLAMNYIAMLPNNIIAIIGVDSNIANKLAPYLDEIKHIQNHFKEFENIEEYCSTFYYLSDEKETELRKYLKYKQFPEEGHTFWVKIINDLRSYKISMWDSFPNTENKFKYHQFIQLLNLEHFVNHKKTFFHEGKEERFFNDFDFGHRI